MDRSAGSSWMTKVDASISVVGRRRLGAKIWAAALRGVDLAGAAKSRGFGWMCRIRREAGAWAAPPRGTDLGGAAKSRRLERLERRRGGTVIRESGLSAGFFDLLCWVVT